MADRVDKDDPGFVSDNEQTPKRKKVKVEEDDSGPSSTASQEDSVRSSPCLAFEVQFGKQRKHCQTEGQETIKNMLICKHPKLAKGKTFENMIFKRKSKDCAINLGLPTGALDEKEEDYECVLGTKKDGGKADYANVRQYNVQNFKKDWNIGRFFIKFDKKRGNQPLVGDIRNEVEMVQIDFFPGESLYEAIIRDKRLIVRKENKLVVRKWYLQLDASVVPLCNDAKRYENNILKLYRKQQGDENLPENVPDLLEPKLACAKMSLNENDSVKPKPESNSIASLVTPSTNPGSQTSSFDPNSKVTHFTCDKDLEEFLKKYLEIEVHKQAEPKKEKKRLTNIKRFFSSNYNNFALKRGIVRSADKMKDLAKMFDSVGAVVVELDSGEEVFKGTCFVIGSQYVITNSHVIENILKQVGFKDFYVDFKYRHGCHGYKFRFYHEIVISDSALDYAILRLCEHQTELPPSLTKCGYVIPSIDRYIEAGDWLTFVGYPQHADGKVMEDACPLKPLQNLDENVVVAFGQLNPHDQAVLIDTNRQIYDTSAFFHGSSGSPGVLMNEKLLIVLHCRGFFLQDEGNSIIEQGVRMSAIRDDVDKHIKDGMLEGYTLNELFDIPLKEEPMEVDL